MLQGFSLVMASRVYFLAVARRILIAMAFLVAEAPVLGQVGSVVAAPKPWSAGAQELWSTGLVAPQHVGSSQTRDRTHVS